MDIVKKNIVSILCGVLAIICVILIFYPFNGLYKGLVENVTKSTSTGDAIRRVRGEARTWPTLSSAEADHVPLKHFPTQLTLDMGTKVTQTWTQDASDFLGKALALQSAHLSQLVPNSLPGVPGQTAIAYQFLDKYKEVTTVAAPDASDSAKPNLALGVLPGRMPPLDADIKASIDSQTESIKATMPKIVAGAIFNQPEIDAAIEKVTKETPNVMRQNVAFKSVVYLDPLTSFQPDPHLVLTAAQAPSFNDIFSAQVGLWLQQEVCRAILETNAGATLGVIDAPIKRLLSVRFTLPYVALPAPPGQAPGEPLTVPGGGIAATHVPVDFTKNPLGHVSNDFYDVIPFQLSLICDAATLPNTLTSLTKNRFIMIRTLDVLSFDSAVPLAQGFIYGDRPVVQVNLRCQYLMLRKFIGPQMPQDIIRGLTAPAAVAPQ